MKNIDEYTIEKILDLYKKGYCPIEISFMFGLTVQEIKDILDNTWDSIENN
jgi:hypothetical protein